MTSTFLSQNLTFWNLHFFASTGAIFQATLVKTSSWIRNINLPDICLNRNKNIRLLMWLYHWIPTTLPPQFTTVSNFMVHTMVRLFLLRQSVLLMSCLVNQIALSVPPSFQPSLIIFVRLNRSKAPLGRTVTSRMTARPTWFPCLLQTIPGTSPIRTAFSLAPFPIVIVSFFVASLTFFIPCRCGVLWTVAAESAIHTLGSLRSDCSFVNVVAATAGTLHSKNSTPHCLSTAADAVSWTIPSALGTLK